MLSRTQMRSIVKCPYNMFDRAFVDNCIFVAKSAPYSPGFHRSDVRCAQAPKRGTEAWLSLPTMPFKSIDSDKWKSDDELRFILLPHIISLQEHMRKNAWQKLCPTYAPEVTRGIISPKPTDLAIRPQGPDARSYYVTSNAIGSFQPGSIRRYLLQHSPVFPYIDYQPALIKEYKDPDLFIGSRALLRRAISRQFRLQAVLELHRDYVSNKDLYVTKPVQDVDPYTLLALLNSKLVAFEIINLSESAQKDDNTQLTQAEVQNVLLPPLDAKARTAIAKFARTLQRYAGILARLPGRGVEIDGIEGIGKHLATATIKIDVKRLALRYRAYSFLDAEAAGQISIAGARTFQVTSISTAPGGFTFSRPASSATITSTSSAVVTYLKAYINRYEGEMKKVDFASVLRVGLIPRNDADCRRVIHEMTAIQRHVKDVINRMLELDQKIDDIILAAASLPAAVSAELTAFPSNL